MTDLFKRFLKPHMQDLKETFEDALESPLLSENQKWGIILACAYTSKQKDLIEEIEPRAEGFLDDATINAAQTAATVMTMNNIYWRFWHMVEDRDYLNIPPELVQDNLQNPEINEIDFELMTIAVSIMNGCPSCLKVHTRNLLKEGLTKEQVLHAIRLASVIQGISVAANMGISAHALH